MAEGCSFLQVQVPPIRLPLEGVRSGTAAALGMFARYGLVLWVTSTASGFNCINVRSRSCTPVDIISPFERTSPIRAVSTYVRESVIVASDADAGGRWRGQSGGGDGVGDSREGGRRSRSRDGTGAGQGSQPSEEIVQHIRMMLSGPKTYGVEELLTVVESAGPWLKGKGSAAALHKLSWLVQTDEGRQALFADARFKALVQQVRSQAHDLNPRSQSMVMAAISRMALEPPSGFLDTYREAIGVRLAEGKYDTRSLTHVVGAFVRYGYHPGHAWLEQFTEVTLNQLMDFPPDGLTGIIYSFSKLGYNPGQAFLKVFTACCKRKLYEFSPRALSSTIQGLATLKYTPSDDWMSQFVDAMDLKLDKYSWLDIPNTVTALSKLLYTPPHAVMRKLIAKAEEKLPSFNPQALANFIFGLFKLQVDPGPAFMTTYLQACQPKLRRFTSAGLASMIHSTARLGYLPSTEFMLQFESFAIPKLRECTRGELWKIIHALATLYWPPRDPTFLEEFWKGWNRYATTVTVKDVSLVLWSLSVLGVGYQHGEQLATLVARSADLVQQHGLQPQDDEYVKRPGGDDPQVVKYRQLQQSIAYLEGNPHPRLQTELKRLSALVEDAWKAVSSATAGDHKAGHRATPMFHSDVMNALEDGGANVSTGSLHEWNIEVLLHPLREAAVSPPIARPVVVLLEGRAHFFTNEPQRMTGDAVFRHSMVRKLSRGSYEGVVSLTFQQWRHARKFGKGGKLRLITELLESHGVPSSVYIPPAALEHEWEAIAREGTQQPGRRVRTRRRRLKIPKKVDSG